MIVCGAKLTHDASVALIDEGRLVFSVEMEKLDNNPRHQRIEDLEIVSAQLAKFGYRPRDVDRFVFDGWRKTHKRTRWGGQEVAMELAPYRTGLLNVDLMRRHEFRVLDLPYASYAHYAGHVAAAYCTSPFAAADEPAYVVCWDGSMFPFLYRFDGAAAGVTDLGALHFMLGETYHTLCQMYPPFDEPTAAPHSLALPGKIMAYAALGATDERAVGALERLYDEALVAAFGTTAPAPEMQSELAGQRILEHMRSRLAVPGVGPADMIASVQEFLGRKLLSTLGAAIEADGSRTPNLCLVGGCALNIKWNRAIRAAGFAERVWIPPFPNDAGSAIGAACCEWLHAGEGPALEWSTYAGPALVSSAPISGWVARPMSPAGLGQLLHDSQEPVVYLDGRAELGPRALGHRSILAAATDVAMKDRLNRIKDREPYRPVAPVCLEERATEIFRPGGPDPHMLFDHDVRSEWRSRVPAICHTDGTARLQTVTRESEPRLFELLCAYEAVSGVPLLCNTSANGSGRGFFPDVASAMRWGRVPTIWSDGVLYERRERG